MSKAILILDKMPENCMECRLKYLDTGDDAYFGPNVYCCVWDGSEILKSGKDEWCPLKPMPTHVTDKNTFAIENKYMNYQDGYNACLDEILKGEKR